MPLDDALEEIHALRGTQFDPDVVDAFEALDHSELLRPVGSGSFAQVVPS